MQKKSPAFEEHYFGDETEVYFLNDEIAVIAAEDAVVMGRPLNRALYDENGRFKTVLAGNLMAVRCGRNSFASIRSEDILVLEKRLKPVERIFDGKIFLRATEKLKIWEEK